MNDDEWIQSAIKRPGSLRSYTKRKYGNRGFTKRGTIKVSYLRKMTKSKSPIVRRRANLALNLRKIRPNKRKRSKKRK